MVYRIGQPINSGGYALVFEAVDTFCNAVALKVYRPAQRPFEEVRDQWLREVSLFEKMRHPNVVAIYDAFVCDSLFYVALERAWGNLSQWITRIGPAPEVVVHEIARQLLFALHFIHTHGVIHRDITIYNVLVFEGSASKGAIYKISDFGISKEFVDPWHEKRSYSQTAHPSFIPPELLIPQFGYTNERSDLYHLGVILLFALRGDLPFCETTPREELLRMIRDGVPRQTAEAIGTPFGDFIAVLLRRSNDYRYASALEAWNVLKSIGVRSGAERGV